MITLQLIIFLRLDLLNNVLKFVFVTMQITFSTPQVQMGFVVV